MPVGEPCACWQWKTSLGRVTGGSGGGVWPFVGGLELWWWALLSSTPLLPSSRFLGLNRGMVAHASCAGPSTLSHMRSLAPHSHYRRGRGRRLRSTTNSSASSSSNASTPRRPHTDWVSRRQRRGGVPVCLPVTRPTTLRSPPDSRIFIFHPRTVDYILRYCPFVFIMTVY